MTSPALRIAFAGTPDFAADHLQALLDKQFDVVVVYSQPDRPKGRGKKLQPSPVKTLAERYSIPVHQPISLNSSDEEEYLKALKIDVMVVVAYGLLLPQSILDTPKYGCLNVHASLLPRWRGAAPIERAILAGDKQSGVTIMQMDEGLDTGDILLTLAAPLTNTDNSETLTARLVKLGCEGLLNILEQIKQNTLEALPQDERLSLYAKKLHKSEALIHWDIPAQKIQKQINAFYPRSPAFCFFDNSRIRIIHSTPQKLSSDAAPGTIIESNQQGVLIACLNSALLVNVVQLAGKKESTIADISNGQPTLFTPGKILCSQEE